MKELQAWWRGRWALAAWALRRSPGRRARLAHTLRQYLPAGVLARTEVTCREGERWGAEGGKGTTG